MKKLKLWHPIAGILITNFLMQLSYHATQSTIWLLSEEIGDWLNRAFVLLLIYIVIRDVFQAVKSIATKNSPKNQKNRKLQNIDRALDEIESTLDAMTEAGQEDGKITPIWGAGTKKDR